MCGWPLPQAAVTPLAGSSHNLNLQKFKLRASNPRTIAYAHFKMPFESSDLPVAEPIFPD